MAHPVEATLVERAYGSPLPFRDEVLSRGQEVRDAHLSTLVTAAQSRGEITRDLDPKVVVFMVGAVVGGLGPFLAQKLGLAPGGGGTAPEPVPATAFERPEVEEVFDEVIRILKGGLAARAVRA